MQKRILFRTALTSLGIALLLAALFFDNGTASPRLQTTETPTPLPGMPTPDRLAQPTLPASPSQADHGAQVYWERCLTCHGDRGQGLTDEFRQTYPPDHQNCWTSKCHGDHPYENGFTLPKVVPAVIGPHVLDKFPDGKTLHAFIAAAMPFWNPGSLTEEEGWSVTAYLLRENELWDGKGVLSEANAAGIQVGPPQTAAAPTPVPATGRGGVGIPFSLIAGVVVLVAAMVLLARFLMRPGRGD